jgi:hypothetical protein
LQQMGAWDSARSLAGRIALTQTSSSLVGRRPLLNFALGRT